MEKLEIRLVKNYTDDKNNEKKNMKDDLNNIINNRECSHHQSCSSLAIFLLCIWDLCRLCSYLSTDKKESSHSPNLITLNVFSFWFLNQRVSTQKKGTTKCHVFNWPSYPHLALKTLSLAKVYLAYRFESCISFPIVI